MNYSTFWSIFTETGVRGYQSHATKIYFLFLLQHAVLLKNVFQYLCWSFNTVRIKLTFQVRVHIKLCWFFSQGYAECKQQNWTGSQRTRTFFKHSISSVKTVCSEKNSDCFNSSVKSFLKFHQVWLNKLRSRSTAFEIKSIFHSLCSERLPSSAAFVHFSELDGFLISLRKSGKCSDV